MISAIVVGAGKALGPLLLFLVEAIRVIAGVSIVLIGVAVVFSLIVSLGALLGIWAGADLGVTFDGLPIEVIRRTFPIAGIIACFFALFIPFLVLALLGIMIISKRKIMSSTVGWSLFAIWMLSILSVGLTVPRIVNDFNRDGTHKETLYYDMADKTVILDLEEVGMDDYRETNLRLFGHDDNRLKLVQKFEARGRTRQAAIKNAQMVTYNVTQSDSTLTFDSDMQFKSDAKFRAQELVMELYIPYEQKFIMRDELRHILVATLSRNGYSASQMEGNTWKFDDTGLHCLTCPEEDEDDQEDDDPYTGFGDFSKQISVTDFTSLEVGKNFLLNVRQGNEYKVTISGDEEVVDLVTVENQSGLLTVTYDNDRFKLRTQRQDVEIDIVMPELEEIKLSGACKAFIDHFDTDDIKVELSGVAAAEMEVESNVIDVKMTGAPKLTLEGNSRLMTVTMRDGSILNALDYPVEEVEIDTEGASSAKLNVTNTLNASAGGASNIEYKGNPENTELNESTASNISKY